ncbi:MAG TPA: transaldolase family protein [Gemmatimonas sp.]|nr:transaldolase family protein [Gemmatimonas sp.]
MKLFLATDALDDVKWGAARALVDGVVLPDAALSGGASDEESLAWLSDFARAAVMPVFVALSSTAADRGVERAEAEAERLGRAADNVVVQLPFAEPYIALMQRLAGTGVRIAATFVATPAQAMLAARTGVSYVFVDVDRLDASGASGASVIESARRVLDVCSAEADLVAVFPAPGAPLLACATGGADAAVVGIAALRALLSYPFSEGPAADTVRRPVAGERLRVTPS